MALSRLFHYLELWQAEDGTEVEVLHREPPHYLQAQCGFLTSSPNGVRTCSDTAAEDQLIRNQ